MEPEEHQDQEHAIDLSVVEVVEKELSGAHYRDEQWYGRGVSIRESAVDDVPSEVHCQHPQYQIDERKQCGRHLKRKVGQRLKHERCERRILEMPGTGQVVVVERVSLGEVAAGLPKDLEVPADVLLAPLRDGESYTGGKRAGNEQDPAQSSGPATP